MKAFPVAIKVISEKANKSYYHLITLDTKQNKVFIKSFGRDEIGKAYQEYIIQEKRAINEPFIDPVLVSATKGSLEKAYPSFFDESNDFIVNLQKVIKESTSKVL